MLPPVKPHSAAPHGGRRIRQGMAGGGWGDLPANWWLTLGIRWRRT